MNDLITVEAAAELIRRGVPLSLAGPASALDQLRAGAWIAGPIAYFMVDCGGVVVTEGKLFATDLSTAGAIAFASYGPDELAGIAVHAPDNGLSIAIIPAGSTSHIRFAADAANQEGAFMQPTVGWIPGVHLNDLGRVTPKVHDGRTAAKHEDRAVVAYVPLPDDKLASVEIVNLFEPDEGALLHVPTAGFEVTDCQVNGETVNFADYLRQRALEHGKLPLVLNETMVVVSVK